MREIKAAGINAVMYYSTDILSGSMPGNARLLAFLITVFNVAMTFPPIVLSHYLSSRPLLNFSTLNLPSSGPIKSSASVARLFSFLAAHAWRWHPSLSPTVSIITKARYLRLLCLPL